MAALSRLLHYYRLQFRLLWEWRGGRRALILRLLASLIISAIAFGVAVWLIPGVRTTGPQATIAAVVLIAVARIRSRRTVATLVRA